MHAEDDLVSAGEARIRLVEGTVGLMEITASTPGAVLIAAGRWLEQRHGAPEERLIEAIGWHSPADDLDSYMLTLALTGWRNVDAPMP